MSRTTTHRRVLTIVLAAALALAVIAVILLAQHGRSSGDLTGPPPAMQFDPDTVEQGSRPRVEVLNGSGIGGLARKVTERLREAGYDVVYYGNAGGGDPARTTVLARSAADTVVAAKIGARLGIRRVELAPDAARLVGVSVVLGKDWEEQRRAKP